MPTRCTVVALGGFVFFLVVTTPPRAGVHGQSLITRCDQLLGPNASICRDVLLMPLSVTQGGANWRIEATAQPKITYSEPNQPPKGIRQRLRFTLRQRNSRVILPLRAGDTFTSGAVDEVWYRSAVGAVTAAERYSTASACATAADVAKGICCPSTTPVGQYEVRKLAFRNRQINPVTSASLPTEEADDIACYDVGATTLSFLIEANLSISSPTGGDGTTELYVRASDDVRQTALRGGLNDSVLFSLTGTSAALSSEAATDVTAYKLCASSSRGGATTAGGTEPRLVPWELPTTSNAYFTNWMLIPAFLFGAGPNRIGIADSTFQSVASCSDSATRWTQLFIADGSQPITDQVAPFRQSSLFRDRFPSCVLDAALSGRASTTSTDAVDRDDLARVANKFVKGVPLTCTQQSTTNVVLEVPASDSVTMILLYAQPRLVGTNLAVSSDDSSTITTWRQVLPAAEVTETSEIVFVSWTANVTLENQNEDVDGTIDVRLTGCAWSNVDHSLTDAATLNALATQGATVAAWSLSPTSFSDVALPSARRRTFFSTVAVQVLRSFLDSHGTLSDALFRNETTPAARTVLAVRCLLTCAEHGFTTYNTTCDVRLEKGRRRATTTTSTTTTTTATMTSTVTGTSVVGAGVSSASPPPSATASWTSCPVSALASSTPFLTGADLRYDDATNQCQLLTSLQCAQKYIAVSPPRTVMNPRSQKCEVPASCAPDQRFDAATNTCVSLNGDGPTPAKTPSPASSGLTSTATSRANTTLGGNSATTKSPCSAYMPCGTSVSAAGNGTATDGSEWFAAVAAGNATAVGVTVAVALVAAIIIVVVLRCAVRRCASSRDATEPQRRATHSASAEGAPPHLHRRYIGATLVDTKPGAMVAPLDELVTDRSRGGRALRRATTTARDVDRNEAYLVSRCAHDEERRVDPARRLSSATRRSPRFGPEEVATSRRAVPVIPLRPSVSQSRERSDDTAAKWSYSIDEEEVEEEEARRPTGWNPSGPDEEEAHHASELGAPSSCSSPQAASHLSWPAHRFSDRDHRRANHHRSPASRDGASPGSTTGVDPLRDAASFCVRRRSPLTTTAAHRSSPWGIAEGRRSGSRDADVYQSGSPPPPQRRRRRASSVDALASAVYVG